MDNSKPKTSTFSVLSLVFAFLCFPLGVIFGIVALIQINGSRGQLGGQGLAIAGLVVSVCFIPMVGILAAIAIPNFIRYQLKSKEAEAKVNLRVIMSAQEAFNAQYGSYLRTEPRGAGQNLKGPWDGPPCSAACDPAGRPEACTEFSCLPFEPSGLVYYRYACEAKNPRGQAGDVTCAALADLDGDGEPGVLVIGTGNASNGRGLVAPIPDLGTPFSCDPSFFQPGQVERCSDSF